MATIGVGFNEGKSLREWALDYFESYIRESRTDVLVFSNTFSSEERQILHKAARHSHLTSKSRGTGEQR